MAKSPRDPDDSEDELEVDPDELEPHDDEAYDPTEHMTAAELEDMAREAQVTEEEYEAALIQDALRRISIDGAKAYLSRYGDAVDARIASCLTEAEQLVAADHPGPALALVATAIEIMIRFLLLRPLVQGAFLSDRWAGILAARIATGRTAEDREMLPAILRQWGLDVNRINSPSGIQVWPLIAGQLWGVRDAFVHRFDPVPPGLAAQSVKCAQAFRDQAVGHVAKRLGFTMQATGKWSAIQKPAKGGLKVIEVPQADPFAEQMQPSKAKMKSR
jgi:hypothetical protein